MNRIRAFHTIDKHLNLWNKRENVWRFNRNSPIPGLPEEYYQDMIRTVYDRTALGLIVPSFGSPGVLIGLRVRVLESAFTWGQKWYSTDIDPGKLVTTYRLTIAEDLGSSLAMSLEKLKNLVDRASPSTLVFDSSGSGGTIGDTIREIHKMSVPASSHDGTQFAKTVKADRGTLELGRSAMLSDFATTFEEQRIRIPDSIQTPARSRLWQQMQSLGIARTTSGNAIPSNRQAGTWDVARNDAIFAAAMAVSFTEFQISRFARRGVELAEIP